MKSIATNGIVLWLPALLLLATSALPLNAPSAGSAAQLPDSPVALHQNTPRDAAASVEFRQNTFQSAAARENAVAARHALPLQSHQDTREDTASRPSGRDGAGEHILVPAETFAPEARYAVDVRLAEDANATASPASVQEASQTSGQARSSGSSPRLTEEPRAAASPASLERPAQALAKTDREGHPSRLAEDTQVAASPASIEEAAQTSAGEDGDSRSAVAEAPGNIQSPDASQRVAQTALESMMYQSIGRRRTEAGLDPLELDQKLTALAKQRSQDMAARDYFSHVSPDGTTARGLMIASGIGPGLMGEILGRNNSAELGESVSSVVDAFMASSSHRGSIVQPRFRAAGVGTAVGRDGMKYYTILFFGP